MIYTIKFKADCGRQGGNLVPHGFFVDVEADDLQAAMDKIASALQSLLNRELGERESFPEDESCLP